MSSLGRPKRQFRTGVLPQMLFFFFSPRVLRGPSTDSPETLPRDRKLVEFYKLTSKFGWGAPPPPKKKNGAKHMQNIGQLCTTSDFDREYLRNEATFPHSESVTNYIEKFLIVLDEKCPVNFGPLSLNT